MFQCQVNFIIYLSYSCFNREENRREKTIVRESFKNLLTYEILKIVSLNFLYFITARANQLWYNIFRICHNSTSSSSLLYDTGSRNIEVFCHYSFLRTRNSKLNGFMTFILTHNKYWLIQILPLSFDSRRLLVEGESAEDINFPLLPSLLGFMVLKYLI